MKKQLAWILGGASIVGLGMIASLNACSGDTQTTDAGGKDSTTKDQATSDVATQDQNAQDTGIQDAGPDCKNVPTTFPFTTDSGPFCPFQQGADGGTLFSACADGEHCCISGSTSIPSTCQATTCTFPTDAATNSDFECNETNDCPANNVCCLKAPGHLSPEIGCPSYDYVSTQRGTYCATACATGEAQICGANSDCTGKTCFPVNTKGMWLGACVGADGGI